MNNWGMFWNHILTNSTTKRYSITKFLALIFTLFLLVYLSIYLFIFKKPEVLNLTLIIQIIGLITILVGYKNKWGVKELDTQKNEPVYKINENVNVKANKDDAGTLF